jgi:UDP-glucose 4,6-dehydratase
MNNPSKLVSPPLLRSKERKMSISENTVYSSILVTGGAGFIGSNFLNYMVRKYPHTRFINFDKLDYCARVGNIDQDVAKSTNYAFVQGDLLDEYLILKILNIEKVDAVVHFAAQSHVDNSFGNSIDFTLNNVLGTHKLLEACRIYGLIKRFIHISTDEVYGEIATGESHEHSILDPTNPYAASKAAAEFIVKSYHHSFKLPVIITRGNNVYGPRQYPEKVIPRFITLLNNNQKCTIQGNGDNIRNFIFVDDTVRAVETILHKGEIAQIYNIGGTEEKTVLEIAKLLIERLVPKAKQQMDTEGWKEHIEFIADRKFNDKRYSVNADKLLALGWKQEVTFTDGFERTVKWYLEHPNHF